MIVAILGLIDVIAGITVLYSVKFLSVYMAYIILFKGLISLVPSIYNKKYLEPMGIIDVAAGIILALMSADFQSGIFAAVGWLILLKGIYSFLRDIFNI